MAEVHLTAEGIAKYEDRLEYLKTVRMAEISEEIKVARAFGDLSENAEYDAAKAEQARVDYEIEEIETMLRDAVLIDEDSVDITTVNVGTTVKIKNLADKKELIIQIVSPAESDIRLNRISDKSPIAIGLLGHRVGEKINIQTPGGSVAYKILDISK
ncbi:MAG: transcription elongation factor GreA [Clostridia bacterium]